MRSPQLTADNGAVGEAKESREWSGRYPTFQLQTDKIYDCGDFMVYFDKRTIDEIYKRWKLL